MKNEKETTQPTTVASLSSDELTTLQREFEKLFARLEVAAAQYAKKLCRSACINPEDLMAISQQKMWKMWVKKKDDVAAAPLQMLYRVMFNAKNDMYRDVQRRIQPESIENLQTHTKWEPGYTPNFAENLSEYPELWAIIRSLDRENKELLILLFVCELSNREIATKLGTTALAIRRRTHRLRAKIMEKMRAAKLDQIPEYRWLFDSHNEQSSQGKNKRRKRQHQALITLPSLHPQTPPSFQKEEGQSCFSQTTLQKPLPLSADSRLR